MKRSMLVKLIAGATALAVGLALFPEPAPALISSHQCNYCHNVHGAAEGALLNMASVEALCLSCHGPGGISSLKADVHQNEARSQYPAFRISCRGCHDSHDNRQNWLGGTNIKIAGTRQDSTGLARIATPNSGVREVAFESRGRDAGFPTLHSFADADEDANGYYDGICETCHTLTKFHQNNAGGGHSHNTGRTCTICHTHTNYFLK